MSKMYTERRQKLQEQLDKGLVLFLGNEESPMNYADNTYHFRQDSTFLYFSGIDRPGLALLADLENGEWTLFGNDLTADDIVWTGQLPSIKEYANQAGIKKTAPLADLKAILEVATKQGRQVNFLPPYRDEHMRKLCQLGIKGVGASVPLITAVSELRICKSSYEIAEIEKAVETSLQMHLTAMSMARPGMTEAQIMAKVTEIALAGGGLAFPVIATINGHVLHNHHYENVLKSGQLFLLDAGAETDTHYAGDLSSTFPVDSTFTQRQKDIYDIMLGSFLLAVDALKPGINFVDIHLQAAKKIAEGLKDLGLMKGDVEDAVAQGAHALFFPCGLGHLMGLDVHDMENLGEVYFGYEGRPKSTQFGLKSLRLGRKLKEGFVLTVEPGIYFMPELIDMWKAEGRHKDFINYDAVEAYRNFSGLRIEEDFVITATGSRRLGSPKPRTVEEVTAIRKG
ncbi:MAG: aminopeptidase P family protein [Holophagaceae bacterium]|nr:aminopeptidase P family protein [Holophagaceae bacterium]